MSSTVIPSFELLPSRVAVPDTVPLLMSIFVTERFVVEEDTILIDDQMPDRDPLVQAKREASLVNSRLAQLGWRGNVTPILVFASDTFCASIAELRGAVVMNSSNLIQSFSNGRKIMDQNEVERLVALMENNR